MNPTADSRVSARRRLVRLAAILAAAAGVLAAGFATAEARSSRLAATPTIYVSYSTDCTFAISTDGGIAITSTAAPGVVIPPGPYQVVVSQAYALAPGAPRCPPSTFQLIGPGVSFSAIVGEGAPNEQATYAFQPSSTYVAAVQDQPLAQTVFTTAASGSSSSLLEPTAPTTPAGQGQVQPGLVGSAVVPDRGTLRATVAVSGRATLSMHGKKITSVEAGWYQIAVDDQTAKAGFTVQKLDKRAVPITSAPFVGNRSAKVDLTAGTWTFYSKAGGGSRFIVSA